MGGGPAAPSVRSSERRGGTAAPTGAHPFLDEELAHIDTALADLTQVFSPW